jgi:hypothetical protein
VDTLILVIRQSVLFLHLIVFAFAIVTVIREDVALLRATRLDKDSLHHSSALVAYLLVLLWLSGIVLVALDVGFEPVVLAKKAKLMTKMTVVWLLTLNGVLLHWLAFPMLTEPQKSPGFAAAFCSVLGAISSVSWMFAAFVGVARLIAPVLNYQLFLELYGVALLVGLMVALLFVRPRLERMLIQQQGPADTAFDTDRQVEDERHSLAA